MALGLDMQAQFLEAGAKPYGSLLCFNEERKGDPGIEESSQGSWVEHERRIKERNFQFQQTRKVLYRPESLTGMFKWLDVGYAKFIPSTSHSVKSILPTHSSMKVDSIRELQCRADIRDSGLALGSHGKRVCTWRRLQGQLTSMLPKGSQGYESQRDLDLIPQRHVLPA